VVAVADQDAARRDRVAARFGIPHKFAVHHALIEWGQIDVVGVCVPALSHAEVAIAALEAGKHVFVEKPLATSLTACDAILAAARNSRAQATTGFNLRWHRLVRAARDFVRQGKTGPIEMVRTVHASFHADLPAWRRQRSTGGGVLFEQAVHHIDLWRFLLDTEVEEVFASTRSNGWEDASAVLLARLRNGVMVTSSISERSGPANEIEIYGTRGRLSVSCYQFDGLRFEAALTVPGSPGERLRGAVDSLLALPAMRHGSVYQGSFRGQWEHFRSAIRSGRAPETTLDDGRKAVQVVLAAAHSASTGRPVRVADAPEEVTAARQTEPA
jgi:myo-inositol 2-dehydrogenase/D-chiro-inositol 1-dehydrogenase